MTTTVTDVPMIVLLPRLPMFLSLLWLPWILTSPRLHYYKSYQCLCSCCAYLCAGQHQTGPFWTPVVTQWVHAPRYLSLPPLSPPYLSSFLSFNGSSTLSPATKQLRSKFRLGRRPPNSRLEVRPGPASLVGPRGPRGECCVGFSPTGPTR